MQSEILTVDEDEAWDAVMRRDRRFDGRFVTGVLSTGIYCRPSCAARHPKRGNVRFFANAAEARSAGLRPCKRCLPDAVARDEAAVLEAIEWIRGAESPPLLNELAARSGYSSSHFQKVFKQATGLSPAAFSRALREERVREALTDGENVTGAIYDAGYGSAARFYDDIKGKLGMAASTWRDGGEGQTIHWTIVETSLGAMLVAATQQGVCRLSFNEDVEELERRFPKARLVAATDAFRALFERVTEAVEHPGSGHDIPLDVQGTAFQQRVWKALRDIPPGETRSYGELAASLGKPGASRAVGNANGANKVAVLIPCHRVIAADGTLGGYAYGTEIKAELLRREARANGGTAKD